MKEEKAYKLLSLQEGISNRSAKELIDRGLVHAKGKKITIARGLVGVDTLFEIEKIQKPNVIDEDEFIIALNKPSFVSTEEISRQYNYPPLHRLDAQTSGVLILVKNNDFREKAIQEFKQKRVTKIYYAIVTGKFIEPLTIDSPLLTKKLKGIAHTKVSKYGKEALSLVEPVMVEGKNSLVQVNITTGRTHQIRVHLQSIGYPIVGDTKYGGKDGKRVMLHSYMLELFNKKYQCDLPKEFRKYGFSIS